MTRFSLIAEGLVFKFLKGYLGCRPLSADASASAMPRLMATIASLLRTSLFMLLLLLLLLRAFVRPMLNLIGDRENRSTKRLGAGRPDHRVARLAQA
ncbi:hypothetical protein [Xanthomonas campestris]|uniref:hypothetical protein n=1 Tax=Xanthomonas campestris TaxID=339 RepID=UPI0024B6E272|nr:hypothetical protein [Xanthomonas campestris]WHO92674.1 hypothetical protein QMY62_21285 [Xanthomonas campestris]